MITLIFNSYFFILSSVTIGSLLIFLIGVFWILKSNFFPKAAKKTPRPSLTPDPNSQTKPVVDTHLTELQSLAELTLPNSPHYEDDFCSIAGDDVLRTQLDLARAYIETGKNQLAKPILLTVINEGNKTLKEEAQLLLKSAVI